MRSPPVLASVLLCLALTACGADDGDELATTSPTTEPSASLEASTPAPAAPSVAPSVAPPPAAVAAPTTCADPAGDSDGVMDLRKVDLTTGPNGVRAVFAWTGAVPQTDSVLWSISASSAAGSGTRQLGYKIVDGQESGHFVFRFADAQQENVSDPFDLHAQTLTVDFPTSALAEIGPDYSWSAVLSIAGDDVDECQPA